VTACDLEKSFIVKKTVEISNTCAFRIMCKYINTVFLEVCELEKFQTAKVTFKVIGNGAIQ